MKTKDLVYERNGNCKTKYTVFYALFSTYERNLFPIWRTCCKFVFPCRAS